MPRGGSRPGERRGGRQKGTPNRATVERQLVAAQIAERTVADARLGGKKLAKDVLEELMVRFIERARHYEPTPPGAKDHNVYADESKFLQWAKYASDCAKALAPYQSPTFRAVEIIPPYEEPSELKPVQYPTVAEIRAALQVRGLPPLEEVLSIEADPDSLRKQGNGGVP
jgi:hypothetical protein